MRESRSSTAQIAQVVAHADRRAARCPPRQSETPRVAMTLGRMLFVAPLARRAYTYNAFGELTRATQGGIALADLTYVSAQ